MEQVVIEILKEIGVYQQAREKVDSDQELVDLFHNHFDELIKKVGG